MAYGVKGELPDVSYTLNETRELMDKGNFQEANWHLTKEVKKTRLLFQIRKPLTTC